MRAQAKNSANLLGSDDLFSILGQVAQGATGVETLAVIAGRIKVQPNGQEIFRHVLVMADSQSLFDASPEGQRFQRAVEMVQDMARGLIKSGPRHNLVSAYEAV